MTYITIRVVGQDGRPKSQAKVQIGKDSILGGLSQPAYTDADGEAEIGWDHGSPIVIYVNGAVVRKNQQVKSHFTISA